MTNHVRRAEPRDFEEAGRVTALAYREFAPTGDEDWESYIATIADVADRADRTTVLVAVEDDAILGSASVELDGRIEEVDGPLPPDTAEVRMLGVHPDERGKGVGRALVEAAESIAREAGRTRMLLHTISRMRAAQRMYEKMGYERGEDLTFPNGFVLLTYEKQLA